MPSPARSERGDGRRPRRDTGQATVELALGLPVVFLCLLLLVQLLVVVRAQLAVAHAAREAARAAAVSADPVGDGTSAARAALSAALGGASVAIAADARQVRATVTLTVHTDVPLAGALVPDVDVRGEAVMQTEP